MLQSELNIFLKKQAIIDKLFLKEMFMKKEHRNYSDPDKVKILRRHLVDKFPISDLSEHPDAGNR
jgi:hypothetical protein